MGLTKKSSDEKTIILAGNPNVGKSTLFNNLTGLHQHTGNWSGKTVELAQGRCTYQQHDYLLIDLPGTYSLLANSAEEYVARDMLCFGEADAVVVVCDAVCLERNLNLVLQILEICPRTLVAVNLLDEAENKAIRLDCSRLAELLQVPVLPLNAKNKNDKTLLLEGLENLLAKAPQKKSPLFSYPETLETALALLEPLLTSKPLRQLNSRWLALQLLLPENSLLPALHSYLGEDFFATKDLQHAQQEASAYLTEKNFTPEKLQDTIAETLIHTAESICQKVIQQPPNFATHNFDRRLDNLLTSKLFGYPLMLLLLAFIFWLTIVGANYPSQLLSQFFNYLQQHLSLGLFNMSCPVWLHDLLVLGVFQTVAWIVAVMLPPMAIFFPLFALLEDSGYLPRIAYNLDKPFQCCHSCGKQALTMAMGFGCNAAGVVGCRIIQAPRERLLAILTNSFVPCNGRFPTLITLLSLFFIVSSHQFTSSLLAALFLTIIILFGIFNTFLYTKLLSVTILKGMPSSFVLELPPYRKPQFFKTVIHSFFDRTFFVLRRAVLVAIPAGLIIWLLANISLHQQSLLQYCTSLLDPIARLLGLDGVILLSFILGLPANEIVLPLILMTYTAQSSLVEITQTAQLHQLLLANGWSWNTALCTILFMLLHWPCATTLLTIKKETGSWQWTALAAILPTLAGIISCILVNTTLKLFF